MLFRSWTWPGGIDPEGSGQEEMAAGETTAPAPALGCNCNCNYNQPSPATTAEGRDKGAGTYTDIGNSRNHVLRGNSRYSLNQPNFELQESKCCKEIMSIWKIINLRTITTWALSEMHFL